MSANPNDYITAQTRINLAVPMDPTTYLINKIAELEAKLAKQETKLAN